MIAYAKKNPGKLNYGSSGVGASPNLSVELFKLEAEIDIVHVPYKGAALAMGDVIGGQLELMTGNLPGPLPQIKAGKLRGLAVTSANASPQAPEIRRWPSRGRPGFDVSSCTGSARKPPCRSRCSTSFARTC